MYWVGFAGLQEDVGHEASGIWREEGWLGLPPEHDRFDTMVLMNEHPASGIRRPGTMDTSRTEKTTVASAGSLSALVRRA